MKYLSNENLKLVKRLLKLLEPFKKEITFVIGFMAISSGIAIVVPLLSRELMDRGLILKNINAIFIICIVVLGLGIAEEILDSLRGLYQNRISNLLSFSLEKTAFKHSIKLKSQYFNNTNTTELMNNIHSDVSIVSMIADQGMFFIILQLFKVVGGLVGLILFVDIRLAILSLAEIPIRYFVLKYLTKRRRIIFEEYIQNAREQASWYGDTIGGIKEIKLYGLERIKIGEFIRKQRTVIKSRFSINRIDIINNISEGIFTQIMTFIVYIVGGLLIVQNSLSVGGLFAFFTYSVYVTGPISSVLSIGYHFASIIPSAKRLFDFLDLETEAQETYNRQLNIKNVQGNIKFKSVSFSYLPGKEVLKNISFEVNKGERVAIVGNNGAGKSSIVNLLLQLNKSDKGSILVDNINIEDYKLSDYRKLFSVVSQNIYLFNSTIRNNISLGFPIKEDMIYRATKDSNAHHFISKMANKYDSQVGSNGSNLSGGERQKIAIARSLVKNSKILILDEANSNCDIGSEYELTKILKDRYRDRTIIAITHRTSLLKLVDKIILIEGGTIQAVGKHEDLYKFNMQYKQLIDLDEKKAEIVNDVNLI